MASLNLGKCNVSTWFDTHITPAIATWSRSVLVQPERPTAQHTLVVCSPSRPASIFVEVIQADVVIQVRRTSGVMVDWHMLTQGSMIFPLAKFTVLFFSWSSDSLEPVGLLPIVIVMRPWLRQDQASVVTRMAFDVFFAGQCAVRSGKHGWRWLKMQYGWRDQKTDIQ